MNRVLAPVVGLLVVLVATLAGLSLVADALVPASPRPASGATGATPPQTRMLTPRELWAAIQAPGTVRTSLGTVELRRVEAGRLVLPSGRVVASDPFFAADAEALERSVAAGRYPVSLVVATYPDQDQRVAVATLEVGPGAPANWELAVTRDQAAASLAPDEVVGYGVDSGTGAFTSAEAAAALAAASVPSSPVADPILQALEAHQVPTWSAADVVLDAASGLDIVVFSSGFGDGAYPSWWGLDGSGRPLVLMTDFGLLDAPIVAPAATAARAPGSAASPPSPGSGGSAAP